MRQCIIMRCNVTLVFFGCVPGKFKFEIKLEQYLGHFEMYICEQTYLYQFLEEVAVQIGISGSCRESVRRSSSESGFISFVGSGGSSSPIKHEVKLLRLMRLKLRYK